MMPTEMRNPKTMHLDKEDTLTMLRLINEENMNSVLAVGEALPEIAKAVDVVSEAIANGGKLVYIGAGTSGRGKNSSSDIPFLT